MTADCDGVIGRTRAFYDWEVRGRGLRAYAHSVALEPPFVPFLGHELPRANAIDDGRRPTMLSSLIERLVREPKAPVEPARTLEEPAPSPTEERGKAVEVELLVPPEERIDEVSVRRWLQTLSACRHPVAFELLGADRSVRLRLALDPTDAPLVEGQLRAFFPAVSVPEAERSLCEEWNSASGDFLAAIEFGLGREFMIPLAELRPIPDPLTPLVGALARVCRGDVVVVQVLFELARAPWASSIVRAVTTPEGDPFFADAPEVTELAAEKLAHPLAAVAIRLAARCATEERAWEAIRSVGGALSQYGAPDRNELVPLSARDVESAVDDVLSRTTHRPGMLLSLAELSAFVRLPGESLRVPALVRTPEPIAVLPASVRVADGVTLGSARHGRSDVEVRLGMATRLQHVHVVGASGTGKSTLLQSLILQDIASGTGVGILDPHGDLIDGVLARLPAERIQDVVLFDPADAEYVVGWNVLGAGSDVEKELLASDLTAVFRRLSTSWGDQMTTVLGNAVLAFLESSRGGTLEDLRRFLLDDDFRSRLLATVGDPHVVSFWRQEFPLLVGKKPQAPILTRLDTFLRSRLVRAAVTERERPLDFRRVIDGGKIFLAKLSQGAIGEENAALLGSLLVSKLHQVALSRQDQVEARRRPFFLYIDEFHQVATPSMASLFSGVRKYRLGLTVAHQDLYQLHAAVPEVERAVLANAATRIAFRVSDEDARKLERGFAGFTREDLGNLSTGEALCRVGRRDDAFRFRTEPLPEVPADEAEARQAHVRRLSMEAYGRPRKATPQEPVAAQAEAAVGVAPVRSVDVREREPREPEARRDATRDEEPGRGGPIHKYFQGLLRQWGQARGFRVTIERVLPSGGRVDVALERDGIAIACEIAGTTDVAHELANIRKCVAEPFDLVVVLSLRRDLLDALGRAAARELDAPARERLKLLAPEELLAVLDGLPRAAATEEAVAGYRVRVRYSGSQGERSGSEREITKTIARSLQRLGRGKST